MLKHVVMMDPKSPDDLATIRQACTMLEGLVGKVEGLLDLHHGPNLDFERKSGRYAYGFIATFADRTAHLAYESHPEHVQAGGMLVASSTGGADGIFVIDLDV